MHITNDRTQKLRAKYGELSEAVMARVVQPHAVGYVFTHSYAVGQLGWAMDDKRGKDAMSSVLSRMALASDPYIERLARGTYRIVRVRPGKVDETQPDAPEQIEVDQPRPAPAPPKFHGRGPASLQGLYDNAMDARRYRLLKAYLEGINFPVTDDEIDALAIHPTKGDENDGS